MITITEAQTIVEGRLASSSQLENDEYIVLAHNTITRNWGWVFFYTSKRYFETGDITHAIAGNAPLFVLKENGKVFTPGTAHNINDYIESFEATGSPHSK